MKPILVAGSINMDVVATTSRHPKLGETVTGKTLDLIPGGKGANQAVAASRLGGRVSLIGRVGNDAFGETLTKFLDAEDLDITGLTISETSPTGTALIVVDELSENTIVIVPGANGEVVASDFEKWDFTESGIIISQFELPQNAIRELFKKGRRTNSTNILNPAPAAVFTQDLLAVTDYLILNEIELGFNSNTTVDAENLDEILLRAKELRADRMQTIIVTLGANGVACLNNNDFITIPGLKVEAKDTTAAGDCFVGAFATALAEHSSLANALEFANAAAALSVQVAGASSSLPTRNEVDRFLNELKGNIH